MRILVTGADGFVGGHLAQALLDADQSFCAWTLHGAPVAGATHSRAVDMTSPEQVRAALEADRPDRVLHLAAFADVGASVKNASIVWNINTVATVNLASELARLLPECGLVFAGSGDSYGATFNKHRPVQEFHPLRPLNPYAASKAAAEVGLSQYRRSSGLAVLRVRSFNCAGPGQRKGFAVSDFAAQVADIEADRQSPMLKVGNLSASRDFVDVRDAADAYAALLQLPLEQYQGQALNLCSGEARTIHSVLNQLLDLATVKVDTELDESRLRPSDVPIALGSPKALIDLTGWAPRRPFDQTLSDALDYWRRKQKSG